LKFRSPTQGIEYGHVRQASKKYLRLFIARNYFGWYAGQAGMTKTAITKKIHIAIGLSIPKQVPGLGLELPFSAFGSGYAGTKIR